MPVYVSLRAGEERVVAEWLSEQWVVQTRGAIDLDAPFAGLVQVTVSGAPGGDVHFHRLYDGGRVVEAGPGPAKNPDVALTLPFDDARDVLEGRLDPSVAFMQGRLKTAGDQGCLLGLLAGWSSPAGAASLAQLRAATSDG